MGTRARSVDRPLAGWSVIALSLAVALGATPIDDPPPRLRYQARVVDPLGNPVDQTLDVVFRIYDSPVVGTTLYTESHKSTGGDVPPETVSQ